MRQYIAAELRAVWPTLRGQLIVAEQPILWLGMTGFGRLGTDQRQCIVTSISTVRAKLMASRPLVEACLPRRFSAPAPKCKLARLSSDTIIIIFCTCSRRYVQKPS
jgi:hypothetical protein